MDMPSALWKLMVECYYTGQTKVALLETQTPDNPYPLESYTGRPETVWVVIVHTGKPSKHLKRCEN